MICGFISRRRTGARARTGGARSGPSGRADPGARVRGPPPGTTRSQARRRGARWPESGGFAPVDFEHTGSTLSATLTKSGTYFVLDVKMFFDSLGIMPDKDVMASASLSARHPENEGGGSSSDGNAIAIERGERRSSEWLPPERLMGGI